MKRIAAVLLALALVMVGASPAHASGDKDCGDFATQQQAQDFYLASGVGDPHRLDGNDGDGLACESLPCPCVWDVSSGTTTVVATVGSRSVGRVAKIVDGDTIDVTIDGVTRRIRVLGIDTPEVYNGVECGGRQASAAMKKLLRVGDRVVLKSDASQDDVDRYDRLLRYVSKRGTDVGLSLVKKGWARPYIYNHNPFARAGAYTKAGDRAERTGRGVWQKCGGF